MYSPKILTRGRDLNEMFWALANLKCLVFGSLITYIIIFNEESFVTYDVIFTKVLHKGTLYIQIIMQL